MPAQAAKLGNYDRSLDMIAGFWNTNLFASAHSPAKGLLIDYYLEWGVKRMTMTGLLSVCNYTRRIAWHQDHQTRDHIGSGGVEDR